MGVDIVDSVENNSVNLCDSCKNEIHSCSAGGSDIIWGDGLGIANVDACSEYEPIAVR